MTSDSTGRALFIVDNSVSGWTGLRALEKWAEIASAFDIATGFFEIGERRPATSGAGSGCRRGRRFPCGYGNAQGKRLYYPGGMRTRRLLHLK